MDDQEYLLSYGKAGDFGRFRACGLLSCRRGHRVVARTQRGQELGTVMCFTNFGHRRLLADKFVGQILRLATDGDLELAQRMQRRSQQLFLEGRRLAAELHLPLEVLDAEILLDGRQATVHYVPWGECDPRPLMDPLAERYRLLVTMHSLVLPATKPEEESATCGAGACGSCSAGTCSSCQSGNCSSCATHSFAKKPRSKLADISANRAGYSALSLATEQTQATSPGRVPLV